jgi:hypothetical protein
MDVMYLEALLITSQYALEVAPSYLAPQEGG